MQHISKELSRQLGGLIDNVDADPSDTGSSSLSSSDSKQPTTMPTLESMATDATGKRLTFAQFKQIDPIGSLSQYHWLMWVQNQLQGANPNTLAASGKGSKEDRIIHKEEKSNAIETKKTLPIKDDNSQYCASLDIACFWFMREHSM
jgi:hypothetical protein